MQGTPCRVDGPISTLSHHCPTLIGCLYLRDDCHCSSMLSSCRAAAGRHVASTFTRACSSLALGLGYPSTGSLKPASEFNELMDGGTRDTHTSTQVRWEAAACCRPRHFPHHANTPLPRPRPVQVRILDLSVIAGLPLALPGAWPLQELPDTKSAISRAWSGHARLIGSAYTSSSHPAFPCTPQPTMRWALMRCAPSWTHWASHWTVPWC